MITPQPQQIQQFQHQLLTWFHTYGRHDLPWQNQSPYHIWLSEIMLQQTQVTTVIPYYQQFIKIFPTVTTLAEAPQDLILKQWAGLGYYHRAKNLHRTAQIIHHEWHDQFPSDLKTLQQLPGIGYSTAAAIASLAFNLPHAICDGNVKRVLTRYFGIETRIGTQPLQQLANACMSQIHCKDYTQAIMDMGATCCKPKNPLCSHCPLQTQCYARQHVKTEHIPVKTAKPKKNQKNYHFLAKYNKHAQIMLEQRSELGIWPGLWCLPEFEPEPQHQAVLQIKHQLTHQTMNIYIYLEYQQQDTPHAQWFSEKNTHALGLPKAIFALLPKIYPVLKSALQLEHPVVQQQLRD